MTSQPPRAPLIYLIAGEPSGDQLGARLMAALKRQTGGAVRFAGIGGERMAAEGLESLFPMSEIAVMGLAEVLPHIPNILRRIKQTRADVLAKKPAALVTIDSPGFSLKVSKPLKGRGIPLVHYVAPSVWAWKPKRAEKIAAFLDHLLTLLPFEPPYFEKHGLPATFVGHPVIEAEKLVPDDPASCLTSLGLSDKGPVLAVLPGSRKGEVNTLGPIFKEAVRLVSARVPDLQCVIPTVANVADEVRALTRDWPVPVSVVEGVEGKHLAFGAATCALAASGTVAVELAVARVPTVVAYLVSPVTAWLARRLLKTKYVSLPNILLDRPLQPERLQEACRPEILADDIAALLCEEQPRQVQIEGCDEAVALLKSGDEAPSDKAARTILDLIAAKAG